MYKVYILFSETRQRYYIGFTADILSERLRKHNSNHQGFTGSVDDWELVYHETYDVESYARARERELKKWKSAKRLKALIAKGKA